MFHTLDGANFEKLREDHTSVGVQLPTGKVIKFFGAKSRSTNGCHPCRLKKKKCDERHPQCGNCKRRNVYCEWMAAKTPERKLCPRPNLIKIRGKEYSETITDANTETNLVTVLDVAQISVTVHSAATQPSSETSRVQPSAELAEICREKIKINSFINAPADSQGNEVVQEIDSFKEDLTNFQQALKHSRSSIYGTDTTDDFGVIFPNQDLFFPMESLENFGFSYLCGLDREGKLFLECYREQYSTFVSIGLDSSNYFLKTFLSIASSNEGITYALTAWGGFFLELRKANPNFTKPWEYMQKATKCMCTQMGTYLKPRHKQQFFELFAFYLIFIGIEVCTGDVRNWRGFMTQCSLLIQSYGGIMKVTDTFGYSNDIKWLLSDFKFHDILSSKCLIDGPIFSVQEYEEALNPRSEYGIDPLQGIIGPIYDIIGDIGRAKADLAQSWALLNCKLAVKDPSYGKLVDEYYSQAQGLIDSFKYQISNCKPSAVHLKILEGRKDYYRLHLSLFDLYTHVCRIQLGISLEKVPPSSVAQQRILRKALPLLDSLQATKVKVALSFSLLVCGISCCSPNDRAVMTRHFRVHSKQYEIGNLQRIEEIVMKAWTISPTGNVCIDWADLVKEKNWHLHVG